MNRYLGVAILGIWLGNLVYGVISVLSNLFIVRSPFPKLWAWRKVANPGYCPLCDTLAPIFRVPENWRQWKQGGWTCHGCSAELEETGKPLHWPEVGEPAFRFRLARFTRDASPKSEEIREVKHSVKEIPPK